MNNNIGNMNGASPMGFNPQGHKAPSQPEKSGETKEVQNEPHLALDGGIDGLDFYRIIAKEGYKHLKSGGYILVEIGYNQKESVSNIFKEYTDQYMDVKCTKDLNGQDRVIEVKRR